MPLQVDLGTNQLRMEPQITNLALLEVLRIPLAFGVPKVALRSNGSDAVTRGISKVKG